MGVPQKQRNRALWIPLVALLAGLNLALLGVLWFAGGDDDTPKTAAQAPAATRTPTPATSRRGDADTRSLSAELEEPAAAIDEMPEPARFASISPPAKQTAPATNSNDRMLTVTEAMLDGSLSITPLHLDIHVYSDNPTERFVFINTSRYGEGDRISEGPTVSTISKQGVILNYQGRDFLLARD